MSSQPRIRQSVFLAVCINALSLWPAAAQELIPAVDLRVVAESLRDVQWPADFNGDGITDLIGANGAGDLQVLIGRKGGTFGVPRALGVKGLPLAITDINRDGRRDVIITEDIRVAVLPGNGDGTFGTPRTIAAVGPSSIALVGDLDNDGHLDVVTAGDSWMNLGPIVVHPGRGDFTFASPIELASLWQVRSGAMLDLNGDGRRDFVLAGALGGEITVFLNQGAFEFLSTAYLPPGPDRAAGVAIRDLTGDNVADLAVTTRSQAGEWTFEGGAVWIARGNGDGTFTTLGTFPTGTGAGSVAIGDFTHDGIPDVATKNQSRVQRYLSMCGMTPQNAESVSILPGRGNGFFDAPITFAVEPQAQIERYTIWGPTLNTNDIDGDGFPDLLIGDGKILFTRGPRANRLPSVSAAASSTGASNFLFMSAAASDPDHHFLEFTWTGGTGGTLWDPDQPFPCYEAALDGYGPHTFTVTVSDGHGGTATDSATAVYQPPSQPPVVRLLAPAAGEVLTAGIPATIRWEASDPDGGPISVYLVYEVGTSRHIVSDCWFHEDAPSECTWRDPGPPGTSGRLLLEVWDQSSAVAIARAAISVQSPILPAGWNRTDVGAVGLPGSQDYDGSTFSVTGSGADIWNMADEFRFVYTKVSGDFDIVTRVTSVEQADVWTKAGLMLRESLDAGSRHASIFATPSNVKGLAFQRRTATNGASVHTAGPALAPGVWLRLSRTGNSVAVYFHVEGNPAWTRIGTPQSFTSLPVTMFVGLAVSSHNDARTATATFDNVALIPRFLSTDIGSVGAAGTTHEGDGTLTLEGSGADIWGTRDAFRYYYRPVVGDATITVRVDSVEQTHAWAKAGVMFRETLAPDSKQVMAIVSPAKGVAVQYRSTTGGATENLALAPGQAPVWLQLTRIGNVFRALVSTDGITWTTLTAGVVPMAEQIYVGVPVTSHLQGALATAVVTSLTVTSP